MERGFLILNEIVHEFVKFAINCWFLFLVSEYAYDYNILL